MLQKPGFERVHALSSAWTLSKSDLHFDLLRQLGLTLLLLLLQISSAFSQLLNLHNLSEEISQAQHERAVRMGEVCHQCPPPCDCAQALLQMSTTWCQWAVHEGHVLDARALRSLIAAADSAAADSAAAAALVS